MEPGMRIQGIGVDEDDEGGTDAERGNLQRESSIEVNSDESDDDRDSGEHRHREKQCRSAEFLGQSLFGDVIKFQRKLNAKKKRIYDLMKGGWIQWVQMTSKDQAAIPRELLESMLKQQFGDIDKKHGSYELMVEELNASLVEVIQEWESEERSEKRQPLPVDEVENLQEEANEIFRYLNDSPNPDELYARFAAPRKPMIRLDEMFNEIQALHRLYKEGSQPVAPTAAQSPFVIDRRSGHVRLKSLVRYDPGLHLRPKGAYFLTSPSSKDEVNEDKLMKCADQAIRMFPFGVCPVVFLRKLQEIYGKFGSNLVSVAGFYRKYPNIFLEKRIKVKLWFAKSPKSPMWIFDIGADRLVELGEVILFPAYMRAMDFDINKFYFRIWHFFDMLLARHRTSIICDTAPDLLEEEFGIRFNPLDWGFNHMVDFFEDCIRKFSNRMHSTTKSQPFLFTRAEYAVRESVARWHWEMRVMEEQENAAKEKKKPEKAAKEEALPSSSLPRISRDFVPRNPNFMNIENVADYIKPGAFIRCVPAEINQHFYFFVRIKKYELRLYELMNEMAKFYEEEKGGETEGIVDPAYLEHPGMYFAALCFIKPLDCYYWCRVKLLRRAGANSCRVVLIDYGTYKTILITSLRYLRKNFLRCLPIQAIWCQSAYPAQTGLPGKERALVGVEVNRRFLKSVEDCDLGVNFLSCEDPKGPWTVRLDELSKPKERVRLTTVRKLDLVDWQSWAVADHMNGTKYDIDTARETFGKAKKGNLKYDKICKSFGGWSNHRFHHNSPEIVRGVYFGYFYPDHNVMNNYEAMVKSFPKLCGTHEDYNYKSDNEDKTISCYCSSASFQGSILCSCFDELAVSMDREDILVSSETDGISLFSVFGNNQEKGERETDVHASSLQENMLKAEAFAVEIPDIDGGNAAHSENWEDEENEAKHDDLVVSEKSILLAGVREGEIPDINGVNVPPSENWEDEENDVEGDVPADAAKNIGLAEALEDPRADIGGDNLWQYIRGPVPSFRS